MSSQVTHHERVADTARRTSLRSLEELAIAAIDVLPRASVMVFDRDLRYRIVRGGALREQGVLPEQLEGHLAVEALGAQRFAFYEPMYRAALDGDVTLREMPSLRGEQTFLVRVGPLRDADGELLGGVAIAVDITEQKQAERWLTTLVDGAPDAAVVADDHGVIVLVNEQTVSMFGYTADELVGKNVDELVPAELRPRHAELRNELTASDGWSRSTIDVTACRKDNTTFPAEVSLSVLRMGTSRLVYAAVRDISQRLHLEEESAFLAAVVRESDDAIIGGSIDGLIVSWNLGAERLYGYRADEAIGCSATILSPDPDSDEILDIVRRVRAGERVKVTETTRRRKDGSIVEVALSVSPVSDARGRVVGLSTIARDISEQHRYQRLLKDLAEHDALTGALNVRRLDAALAEQTALCRRHGEHAVLLSLDLDDFKHINDTFGHHAGDVALKDLVATVTPRLRSSDVFARIGGDEFVALLRHTDLAAGRAIAEDLRSRVAEVTVEGSEGELHLAVSIGVVAIDDCADGEEARSLADAALYAEKASRHELPRRPPVR